MIKTQDLEAVQKVSLYQEPRLSHLSHHVCQDIDSSYNQLAVVNFICHPLSLQNLHRKPIKQKNAPRMVLSGGFAGAP